VFVKVHTYVWKYCRVVWRDNYSTSYIGDPDVMYGGEIVAI